MPVDGRAALQAYMDRLLAPLNDALNSIAAMPEGERPRDPVHALARLLQGEPPSGSVVPSKALAALLGEKTGRPMSKEALFEKMMRSGALSFDALSTAELERSPSMEDSAPPASPCLLGPLCARPSNEEVIPMVLDATSGSSFGSANVSRSSSGKKKWQKMLKPALQHKSDATPWAQYELHKQPTELCVRWDYNAETDAWERSETLIKMERESFAHGAMRECYRMKKMSQVNAHFFYAMDWKDCNNYVAKRYIAKETPSSVYFTDIKMQMVAKRFAKKYNSCLKPPKGVDFLHAFVIEVERNGETLCFCVERAMEEGGYVKYNNNSGFVEYHAEGVEHAHRYTPHAFSRYSFFESSGELMVVDIQGVDDVYTDPQIHTAGGQDYGEGNLGYGGMALFFSTSAYDSLCQKLKLPSLALSPNEKERIASHIREMTPRNSMTLDDADMDTDSASQAPTNDALGRAGRCTVREAKSFLSNAEIVVKRRRSSICSKDSPVVSGVTPADAIMESADELHVKGLPLAVLGDDPAAARAAIGMEDAPASCGEGFTPTFVGPVHAKLAELALAGAQPLQKDKPDIESAGFHLVCAAAASEPRALRDLRSLCRGLTATEVLPGVKVAKEDEETIQALLPRVNELLAAAGDLSALVEQAQVKADNSDLPGAIELMRQAVAAAIKSGEADALGGCAPYQLLEKLGHMQLANDDSAGAAESFGEASEAAMEAGKAKLAMKLSALAEEHACD